MLKLSQRSKKINKTTLFTTNSKNSYKDLFEKDKKPNKRIDKRKNKTMKVLKTFDNIDIKEEKKSIFSLGEIKIAKIHKEVTRPLKKLKDLTKEELKNNSCPCCGLPTKIDGKLEDYKMCDNPDEFSNCGEGVILYFSFFKFCIFVTFIASIGISIFNSIISYNYYNELRKLCDSKHFNYNASLNFGLYYNPGFRIIRSIKDKCKIYSSDYIIDHKLLNSFFFKVSSINHRNYKNIARNFFENEEFESTIININLVNFLCLINIFIAYLVYIFFIYNKSNAANYLVYTVGDYSILLTNLNDIYKKFDKNLEYIINKEMEYNNINKKLEKKEYEDKLGFEPEENMPKLDLFKKFLEKKIFIKKRKKKKAPLQYYNISRIDLCFKLDEIINLQKAIEELDEKIERIEFDQSMIEKNNKKGITGNKRIYYSCCLCCEEEESLEQIKKKREENEKAMNELIESSRDNTSEHFCGAAIVIFNTIKEQEEYLSQMQKNCCYRLMDAFITLFKIFFYCLCPYCFCCLCCCCCFCCYCSCCSCDKKESLNFYKRKIGFERAPEPEDIIFENLEISYTAKLKNIICVSVDSLIICGINLFIIEMLYIIQLRIDDSKDQNNKSIILYIFSFLITIANSIIDFILEIVLEKIIKKEKSYTLSDFYANYSVNLTFFWFLNSCLIPVVCDIILASKQEHEVLTSNMLIKFLFNSFVTPIMWTMNFKFVYKKFKQCIIEQKEKINYNQKELNELYELQAMNVAVKYSYLIKTLLMSFIFAPIFPLGFCISLAGFIFAYWLEKFNFSKMYKKPEKLDKQITEYYISYFIIVFLAYGLGSFYFFIDFEKAENILSDKWVRVISDLSTILLFIPINVCFHIDFLKIKESTIHSKTYDEMYLDFLLDYERANPMTRIEGEMRYLDKLEENNRISKVEKDKRKKKIKEENQMKSYLRQQRFSRILNIKELNNILNLNDDKERKKEQEIIGNIDPNIENYKKKETVFKIKKSIKKTKKKNKQSKRIPLTNESGSAMQSDYLMNKTNSSKTKQNYS